MVLGAFAVTFTLQEGQAQDLRTLELAGRQRMLGQRAAKHAYAAHVARSPGLERARARDAVRDLEATRAALAADASRVSASARVHLRASVRAARALEAAVLALGGALPEEVATASGRVERAEEVHLRAAVDLATQLAMDAETKLSRARWAGVLAGLGVLAVLLVTAGAVIEPAAKAAERGVARLGRAKADAEAATTARERFVLRMSHVLKTPLHHLLGQVDRIAEARLDPATRAQLASLRASAAGIARLVDDLVELRSEEAVDASEELDVVRLIEEIAAREGRRALAEGRRLSVAVDPTLDGTVLGRTDRFRQSVIHLLDNALRHGQGPIRLEVERGERDLLEVAVSDAGPGVGSERVRRLFEPFADPEEEDGSGLGVGLAVVRRFARRSGGDAGHRPTDDGGSRFWFTARMPPAVAVRRSVRPGGSLVVVGEDPVAGRGLERWAVAWGLRTHVSSELEDVRALTEWARREGAPPRAALVLGGEDDARAVRALLGGPDPEVVVVPPPGAPGIEDPPWTRDGLHRRLEGAAEADPPRIRVLVVDDDAMNREVSSAVLDNLGCAVEVASSGTEALERLSAREAPTVDLVLMDFNMPKMDGAEATRRIRALERGRRLPVVALTAASREAVRPGCLDAGMNEVLGKPIDIDRLVRVLEDVRARRVFDRAQP